MGSICYNNPEQYWEILLEGELKCNGEIDIKVKTGEVDDYMSDGILTVWMNKKVYDKLMNHNLIQILLLKCLTVTTKKSIYRKRNL